MLYPGLATKVFSAFRCTEIVHGDTIITHLLQADPSVVCHSSIEHGSIVLIATVFLILYVVGIPLCILFLLWKNRKHLHDTKHPQHQTARFTLGAVYLQFVSGLLWFFCEFLCFVLLLYHAFENICVILTLHIHTCRYVLTFVFLPSFSLSSCCLFLCKNLSLSLTGTTLLVVRAVQHGCQSHDDRRNGHHWPWHLCPVCRWCPHFACAASFDVEACTV